MFDADLVKDPRDVVANSLLRGLQRCGNRGVIETLGNSVKDSALTRGKRVERQGTTGTSWEVLRWSKRASHFVDQFFPSRLVCEKHVVIAVELDEAAVGNQAREQPAFFDRYINIAFGVHDQNRAFDLARGFSYIGVTSYLKQLDGCLDRKSTRLNCSH